MILSWERDHRARSLRVDLNPFTLVGATTRAGQLSSPLRDRFGVILRLELYTTEQLTDIVRRSAMLLKIPCSIDGAMEIASRARGTPRIANRLLKRVRDFADEMGNGEITTGDRTYGAGSSGNRTNWGWTATTAVCWK